MRGKSGEFLTDNVRSVCVCVCVCVCVWVCVCVCVLCYDLFFCFGFITALRCVMTKLKKKECFKKFKRYKCI